MPASPERRSACSPRARRPGILAERKLSPASVLRPPDAFGSVRGDVHTVVADDGLELYAEVDEPDRAPEIARVDHRVRARLRPQPRLLALPAAGHARRAPAGALRPALARPLGPLAQRALHDRLPRSTTSPPCSTSSSGDGPVVLVGHSMGGMTIMALAEQHPEWFGSKILGVALISTSAGELQASTLGLPGLPGRAPPPAVAGGRGHDGPGAAAGRVVAAGWGRTSASC